METGAKCARAEGMCARLAKRPGGVTVRDGTDDPQTRAESGLNVGGTFGYGMALRP